MDYSNTPLVPIKQEKPWAYVSGSQVAGFDAEADPKSACQRRWAFEKLFGLKQPERDFHIDGKKFHTIIEDYYLRGIPITNPVVLGGMIYAPTRSAGLLVEKWFTLQIPDWPDDRSQQYLIDDKYDGLPIGYGRWVGRSDLLDMTSYRPIVIDFKNVKAFSYVKKEEELAKSPPMIAYGKWALDQMPQAESVVLKHIANLKEPNTEKKGPRWKHKSKEVRIEVSRAEINAAWDKTVSTVHTMRKLSVLTDWQQFPANRKACYSFGGCHCRSLCGYSDTKQEDDTGQDFLANLTGSDPGPVYDPDLDRALDPVPSYDSLDHGESMIIALLTQLDQIFSTGKVPDATSTKTVIDLLATTGHLPPTDLQPDMLTMAESVMESLCKRRVDLITQLETARTSAQAMDPGLVEMLRPLQGWYVALGKIPAGIPNGEAAARYRSLATHSAATVVIAWIQSGGKPIPIPVPDIGPLCAKPPCGNSVTCKAAGSCLRGPSVVDPIPLPPDPIAAPVKPAISNPAPDRIKAVIQAWAKITPKITPEPDPAKTLAMVVHAWQGAPGNATDKLMALILGRAQPNTAEDLFLVAAGKTPAILTDNHGTVQLTIPGIPSKTLHLYLNAIPVGTWPTGYLAGRIVIQGTTWIQYHKDLVARQERVSHYKAVTFGKGPGLVVSAAREEILSILTANQGVILILDGTDEVQAMLGQELTSSAEMVIQGTIGARI